MKLLKIINILNLFILVKDLFFKKEESPETPTKPNEIGFETLANMLGKRKA